jgi:predicted lipid carrier protein YhbT
VASVDECREALHRLADRLADDGGRVRDRLDFERTLECRVTDLGVAFRGRLSGGHLVDISDGEDPRAKIRLSATSDDLLALVDGQLDVTRALAARRISINANPFDLLKLRKLL